MKIIEIKDPKDYTYPLDKKWQNNKKILYHGTWSCFCSKIESKGWRIDDPPYDFNEIFLILEISEDLYLKGETFYRTLKNYTSALGKRGQNIKKFPSYTRHYWLARNYASYKGGEAIYHLLESCKVLLKQKNISEKNLTQIRDIRDKYDHLTQEGYGVVYVIEIEDLKEIKNISPTEINLNIDVPPNYIKARINFPCGINPSRPN